MPMLMLMRCPDWTWTWTWTWTWSVVMKLQKKNTNDRRLEMEPDRVMAALSSWSWGAASCKFKLSKHLIHTHTSPALYSLSFSRSLSISIYSLPLAWCHDMLPLTQRCGFHHDWNATTSGIDLFLPIKSAKFWCRGEKIKLLSLWAKEFSRLTRSDKAHKSDHQSYLCLNVVHWLCLELTDQWYICQKLISGA